MAPVSLIIVPLINWLVIIVVDHDISVWVKMILRLIVSLAKNCTRGQMHMFFFLGYTC